MLGRKNTFNPRTFQKKSAQKKFNDQQRFIIASFVCRNFTKYPSSSKVAKYISRHNIIKSIIPIISQNITMVDVYQTLKKITLVSIRGIGQTYRITTFRGDGLISLLLFSLTGSNEYVISVTLNNLEIGGHHIFLMLLLSQNGSWLNELRLESISSKS